MTTRFLLAICAALSLSACNTFGSAPEFASSDLDAETRPEDAQTNAETDTGRETDAGADAGSTGIVLLDEENCTNSPRQTRLAPDFLTGDLIGDVSAAWANWDNASTLVVGLVDGTEATTYDINIPSTGQGNALAVTRPVESSWGLVGHQASAVDLINPQQPEDGAGLLAVFDPCDQNNLYGMEGMLEDLTTNAVSVPCVDDLLPIAAEYVGGISEFDGVTTSPVRFVIAEFSDSQTFIAVRDHERNPAIDVLPRSPTTRGDFDLRGTTGEVALAFDSNDDAYIVWTTDGTHIPLLNEEGDEISRTAIELDIVHLDDNRYVVAYTDGNAIVLARYDTEPRDPSMGPGFSFEYVGEIERLTLDGPAIGVGLAAFDGGFAVLSFEREGGDEEWSMRPYLVSRETFTPFACDSDFSYSPITMESFDVIARRDSRDLVVQQANSFRFTPEGPNQVNVEGFIYEDFFGN